MNEEVGYNVLKNKNLIKEPPIQALRRYQYFINTNRIILDKIKNKEKLTNLEITICDNTGGGHCYFKTISQFFNNTEKYHYITGKK